MSAVETRRSRVSPGMRLPPRASSSFSREVVRSSLGARLGRRDEPEADLRGKAAAGVEQVDPHPVKSRERRLARLLPLLEPGEGPSGLWTKNSSPAEMTKRDRARPSRHSMRVNPLRLHGANPRSLEMKRTATVSGPARPACRALSRTRFRPSPSSAISQASAIEAAARFDADDLGIIARREGRVVERPRLQRLEPVVDRVRERRQDVAAPLRPQRQRQHLGRADDEDEAPGPWPRGPR